MRERAQASVETIALLAAVVALAAALSLGVARVGPPLAEAIAQAISAAFDAGEPTAPALDSLERLLLAGATSADPEGPTLLDLRASLRSRLGSTAGDTAFAATLRPLVARALSARSIVDAPENITLVGRDEEDSWLRERFHPGTLSRFKEFAVSAAGTPGALATLFHDAGLAPEVTDGIDPGRAAGDVVVELNGGLRDVLLRRRPGTGLTIIGQRTHLSGTGDTQP
jgi:hypothetical protein